MAHPTVDTAAAQQLDASDGPWVAICEQHGAIVNAPTRAAASSISTADFCEECLPPLTPTLT